MYEWGLLDSRWYGQFGFLLDCDSFLFRRDNVVFFVQTWLSVWYLHWSLRSLVLVCDSISGATGTLGMGYSRSDLTSCAGIW